MGDNKKSLRQVAKELGVSASYLSQIRHGKRPASEKMLNTLLFKDVQTVKQHDNGTKACYNSINSIVSHDGLLGHRLAVGQRTLDPLAEVRILVPQLFGWRIRLAAKDAALSRRRSGVRIPYALPLSFRALFLKPKWHSMR